MFRNVRLYRLKGDWPDSEEALSNELSKAEFKPCGPLTERSSGWTAINPGTSEILARRLNGADLLKLRSQSRVLPAAVINEALEERIEEFRSKMGEEPGTREKRRLKAETREALLPKALLKSDRIWGYFDHKQKLLAVATGQESVAERYLRHLKIPFDQFETRPLQYNEPVEGLLTRIFLGDAPERFVVGRECRMQDISDSGSNVRWTDFDLSDSTIRKHVSDGMRLTHLAIEYDSILGCVLDENGVLSKIRLLGADDKDGMDDADPLARLDAEFVLVSGILRNMVGEMKKLLGGFA